MSNADSLEHLGQIAVVGMSARFPGARNVARFWENLRDGVESISHFSDEELAAEGVAEAVFSNPKYVRAKAILDDIEMFDAAFFGINPREAQIIDPQHRFFLECASEALEVAGYDSEKYEGRIGIFASESLSTYFLMNLLPNVRLMETMGNLQMAVGNDRDFLATRVSFAFNLRGPSVVIQSACSSSLVAVHLACQSLLSGESDMVLAAGASISLPQKVGYMHLEGGISSPDGHCRVFDAKAGGTLGGNGIGVVLLKRLGDALADGDHIHAVIRGSALNNDGSDKIGYTAPSVEGQARVIAEAMAVAGVEPSTVGYVETHGTGTHLGDPIEVAALTKAFRGGTDRKGFCAIGSVKSNFGHLDAAAGVAGLIKAVLSLEHRMLPPSLHFEEPNPQIDFASGPFYVNSVLTDWVASSSPRRAGVSSFGIGGTNAHVVLEEAPEAVSEPSRRPSQLLILSARTKGALERATLMLGAQLGQVGTPELADVAYTLQVGRRAFAHRRALVAVDVCDAAAALAPAVEAPACDDPDAPPSRVLSGHAEEGERQVVFMFPGGGAQHVGMGRELYDCEPVFRDELDRCAELLRPQLGYDLRELLYPEESRAAEAARQLKRTKDALPSLFSVCYALARLWVSWGVRPAAMIGHSLGEYVAACVAGVFSLEDALRLVTARARLFEHLPAGAMLGLTVPEAEARALMEGRELSLAAINGPQSCVVSGAVAEVAALAETLAARGVEHRLLHIDAAGHSQMVEPILEPFSRIVAGLRMNEPQVPFMSNVTGRWITAAEAQSVEYWVRHLREGVRFGDGIAELLKEPSRVLLEVGPGADLSTLARSQMPAQDRLARAVSSMRHPQEQQSDCEVLLGAAGRLWLAGVELKWEETWRGERRRRVPLPTYPFERQRFWVDALKPQAAQPASGGGGAVPDAADASRGFEGDEAGRVVEAGEIAAGIGEAGAGRTQSILSTLKSIITGLTGIDSAEIDTTATFFELGVNSLLLIQACRVIEERFGVKITFRQMLQEYTSMDALTAHIDEQLPQEKAQLAESADAPAADAEATREGFAPALTGQTEPGAAADSPRGVEAGDGVAAREAGPCRVPLTEGQEQVWLAAQMTGDATIAYNESVFLRARGPLNVAALRRAIDLIVERHAGLRVVFSPHGDYQEILPDMNIAVPLIDFAHLDADEREARVAAWLEGEVRERFDLARGPLLRVRIGRLDELEHVLALTIHHIVTDGWSLTVFVGELREIYSALCQGQEPRLSPAESYVEHARRRAAREQGAEMAEAELYWLDQFADSIPVLNLPTDRPRPAAPTFRGHRQRRVIEGPLSGDVVKLSARYHCTTFITQLVAFSALLRYLTGQPEFIVGIHAAGQLSGGAPNLIGYWLNLLPLRAEVGGDLTFAEYLALGKRKLMDAFGHQVYPLGRLIKKLSPRRDPARPSFVALTFNVDRSGGSQAEFYGLEVSGEANHNHSSKFDLSVNVVEGRDRMTLVFDYSTDLFDALTVGRWMEFYEHVLRTVAADPEIRMSALKASLDEIGAREQLVKEDGFRESRRLKLKNVKRKAA
ncbi:MAG: condensation domain-containing protein [Acidobacteria bacterium]|nr:condensation domain-containing protein [Acidobacteriota bacterium]